MMRCRGGLLSALRLAQGGLRSAARLVSASTALLIPTAPAPAAAPLRVRVVVTSAEGGRCPGPDVLIAALRRALPTSDALVGSADPDSEVVVRDLGAEYVVRAAGQRRRFSDPLRTCDERARVAAVFSSLALHPPGLTDGAAPAAAPPVRAGPTALLEAAGLLGGAAGAGEPILTGGGALRLYVGKPALGASLGLHGLAPQTQRLAAGFARVFLLPVDVSVRLRWLGPRFEVAGEAGVLLSLLQLDAAQGAPVPAGAAATTFTPAEPVLRLDAGLRLAVDLRTWVSARVAPLLGIDAWLWPRPYQLVVAPQGVVAERPFLMLVGRVGLTVRLR